ncbi:MAG: nucleotidyltransferase domain-containing protein [Chloroflexi bacterium]|nr:nucleotidyltransferase domain-containing protein [Chloroflexota bacterium]
MLRDKLSTLVQHHIGVRLVYLFGSQIEGDTGPMSDYDFAVLIEPAVDGRRLQAALTHELSQALGAAAVDVVLLNRVPIELAYAVIAQGTVLFEQDIATRIEYEADVLSRYADYLPVLRTQRDDILRGGEHVHRVQRYREALGRTRRALGQIAAPHGQGSGRL